MMKSARTSIKNPARKPRPKLAPSPPSESPASGPGPAEPTDSFVPYPLFPPIVLLTDHQGLERPINNDVRARLDTLDPALEAFQTWRLGINFLAKQCQRPEFSPRHYKIVCPVLETMMHWSWSIRHKPFLEWQETDAREFMRFVMRLPNSWISKTGGTRYLLKTKTEFAVKPINNNWRPIVRKQLADISASTSTSTPGTGSDFALGTVQHRTMFLRSGRDFFNYLYALRTTTPMNPFDALKSRDFEVRQVKTRTIFTPAQLSDLMSTATSLAQSDKQWESWLLVAAMAIYSDVPLRALGSSSALRLTFSSFKAGEADDQKAGSSQTSPEWFESPHYPRLRYPLAPPFAAYFRRYAKFRHSQNSDVSPQSLLLPLMDGTGGYSGHTLVDLFCRFTTTILTRLQQSSLAGSSPWRSCDHLQPGASVTFLELRKSARAAGWVPRAVSLDEPHHDESVWPDLGICKNLPAGQWLHRHGGGPSL
ncbi:hypothetical protein G7021_25585 [Pseudomonas carnis]|uniref:hypothetical protein n=1 Tax=Pseudomonas carnis TaxID=2487355 RepID=UPI0015E33BDE|nr:hypothetical protein [Pseudomonas carnis]MBA1256030.1 hypothetical protein [Pseudomonas carnis]